MDDGSTPLVISLLGGMLCLAYGVPPRRAVGHRALSASYSGEAISVPASGLAAATWKLCSNKWEADETQELEIFMQLCFLMSGQLLV